MNPSKVMAGARNGELSNPFVKAGSSPAPSGYVHSLARRNTRVGFRANVLADELDRRLPGEKRGKSDWVTLPNPDSAQRILGIVNRVIFDHSREHEFDIA